ncbi:transposase, partial [Kingella kingae]|uniref:transposase n=1 Tax=Kingella kingae TaxID=504 RepID=UPI003D6E8FBF
AFKHKAFSDFYQPFCPLTHFLLFCQFPDETQLPDHSTLNRFRNWLLKKFMLLMPVQVMLII